jgi:hypothetical protein
MINIGKKGEAETISYVFIILIIALVVGAIMTGLIPIISQQQSITKFEHSKNYISSIDNTINELMIEPTGSGKVIPIDLSNLYLEIDEDNNTIQIYHLISGEYYDNHKKILDGVRYTYRDNQKIYAGLEYTNIDITTDVFAQNKKVTLYLQKVGKRELQITTDTNTDELE